MSASSISFDGFITSMTEMGFTPPHCMNEKIENSDSANAKNIKIILQNGQMVIVDDGNGMNEEEMKTCGKFHNRSSSSALKHGTKGVGGNIADINLSGSGRVTYCSKSASARGITYMELNYSVDTEEEYRPRPQEAPRRIEQEVWDQHSLDKTHTGTVQQFTTVPPKMYNELVESIKSDNIIHCFRRIWAFTYESILRSGKTISFDVEGELFTLYPIDMMKYNETKETNRRTDHCSVWKRSIDEQNEEIRVCYTNQKGKLCYRDYSKSNKGNETTKTRPEDDGFTKIGNLTLTHTHNNNWRELHSEEMERNGIDTACSDQHFLNNIGGGALTIARNHKHVVQFPTCQTGVSAGLVSFHQNSKHLLDYDANDDMDPVLNIQLNKSNLVKGNIQKEVIRTIDFLNGKFIARMKTQSEKQEVLDAAAVAAVAAAEAEESSEVSLSEESSEVSLSEESSEVSLSEESSEVSLSEVLSEEPEHHNDLFVAEAEFEDVSNYTNEEYPSMLVPSPIIFPPVRVIVVQSHTRETIPQNHGIQILQALKQQPQYHDAMNDTVDTLLVECCRRILDERIGRTQTKRLINIGSFEKKCDLLCELLQECYVIPQDTMRHGAELHRKYNAVVNSISESLSEE